MELETKENSSNSLIPDFSGKRILISEDNDLNLFVAKAFLKKTNADLDFAKDGKETLEKVKNSFSNPFSLIFMDVQMPEMDGLEACRQIRKLGGYCETVPVIAMTGNVSSEDKDEALEAGMNDYITKPVKQSEILSKSAHILFGEDIPYIKKETPESKPPLESAPKAAASNTQKVQEFDFSGKRFLIVDDNKLNLEILHLMLNKTGCDIVEASDGVEALEKYMKSAPGYFDIILMDILMPRMDGNECAKKIRSSGKEDSNLPIIAISANAFQEDKEKSMEAGINFHMSKPINMKILFETVKSFF